MKQLWIRWATGAIVVVLILVYGFTFVQYEGELTVVTRFGAPRTAFHEAGLHWKLPWPFEKVFRFDGRRNYSDTSFVETLTKDKKNVILQTYVVWSIEDPLRFLQSIGNHQTAVTNLNSLVNNAKNAILGKYDLSALVSTNKEELKLAEIEQGIYDDVKDLALNRYGVTIHQIGLKRLGLPEANIQQVFQQMRAERQQYAARFRAEGQRDAAEIRNEADVKVAKLRAEGMEEAAKIIGETETKVAKIYADAHSANPDFFSFLRRINSLEKIIGANATMILRTDTAPFDVLLEDGEGK